MSAILVVAPAWVGDMVMTQSLLITLKQQDERQAIDVLAQGWSVNLAQRMPEVRETIEFPAGHGELKLGRLRALARDLRRRGYDRAVVCPRSAKAALVPFLARIPERTGFRGEFRYGLLNDIRALDKSVLQTPAQRWTSLGLPRQAPLPPRVPYPRLEVDAGNQTRLKRQWELDCDRPIVALVPGAEHGSAKRWPAAYFAQLARSLDERGARVWLMGSPKEAGLAERINAQAGHRAINLCGGTTLPDAVDLLALTDAVVSNDSGLMHVAAAVGTFVVALYGSSTPAYTPPLTDTCRILYLNLECSPCFASECPLGHHNCLRQISPEMVLGALPADLLDR